MNWTGRPAWLTRPCRAARRLSSPTVGQAADPSSSSCARIASKHGAAKRGCASGQDRAADIAALGMILRMVFSLQPPQTPRHRSEEHTSELQSHSDLVCRLLLEKKKEGKSSDKPTA